MNINYADTGLFGVYAVGSPNDMNSIVKAVVSEMRQVAKSISAEALEVAKYVINFWTMNHFLFCKWMSKFYK